MATYATLPYPTTDLTVLVGLYNDAGQIWNGASYVALSTLADIAAWRALLIVAPELELSDATGAATYQTADIAAAIAADQSCVVVFYSGATPAPADAIAQQDIGAAESASAIGSGAISTTITCQVDGNPIDGMEVWITTDEAGTNVVAGTLSSDALGLVTFMLDAGDYFAWRQKAGLNLTNPYAITVS